MTDRDRSDAVAEAQGLASDLIDWLEERTASGYPTRRAATALGLAAAGVLTALREDPRRWADLVVQTARQMGASSGVTAVGDPVTEPAVSLLRPAQAAKLLGISMTTLWRESKKPGFPTKHQISPNAVGFREHDVRAYVRTLPAVEGE